MPTHVVQELTGHSDIRTTRRYYVQVKPEPTTAAREYRWCRPPTCGMAMTLPLLGGWT